MEPLWQDLRYAVRVYLKSPGLTFIALMTLALGIGAGTAIFSVVNAVLLRPLPYQAPDRLVMAWTAWKGEANSTVAPANFLDWRAAGGPFGGMAAFSHTASNLEGDGEPERLRGASVSTNFFQLLGIDAARGRTFVPGGDSPDEVVLSHDLWQRRFGGDPSILGRRITLSGQPYAVIGVMPPAFSWPSIAPSWNMAGPEVDLWLPARVKDIPQLGSRLDQDLSASRDTSYLRVVGRLREEVSLEQAQAAMDTLAASLAIRYPDTNADVGVRLVPLARQIQGSVRPVLMLLFAAVGLLLVIACANVANLFLARSSGRQRELAVRVALGASPARLVRQMFVESVMLSVAAGAVGGLLALWGVDLLVALSPDGIPHLEHARIDGRVLAFTLAVSIGAGMLCGLFPAMQASSQDPGETLKASGGKLAGGRQHTRRALVVLEVALSMLLLIGAGLLVKSLARLTAVDPGIDTTRVLTFKVNLPASRYEKEQAGQAIQQLLERVRAVPGVDEAATILDMPLGKADIRLPVVLEAAPDGRPGENAGLGFQVASPAYFKTLGIPVVQGRAFSSADDANGVPVAILSQSAARRLFPGQSPIDRRIRVGDPEEPWRTVVGVVGDVHHHGLAKEARAEVYLPFQQDDFTFTDVVVQAQGDPLALVAAVRAAVRSVDPLLPLDDVKTLEARLAESVASARFVSRVGGAFSVAALLLAALGLYGLLSFTVVQRAREMGVRMALGARPQDVMRLVIGQAMGLVGVGMGAGLLAAFALTRLMSGMLFGVSATDPSIFAAIALGLLGVGLLASYLPARRATQVDPVVVLRAE